MRPRGIAFRTVSVLLAGVLVLAWIFAERVNFERQQVALRSDAQLQLTQVRDRLQGHLNSDLQLVKGLVSVINLEPQLTQPRFAQAARPLLEGRTHLRNIAAAPDMVIQLMYPLQGNERAIGLDYRSAPGQAEAAERARTTRQIVLAGPFALVQGGGTALAARMPVTLRGPDGQDRFWGLVSAVIDVDRLFQSSGLLDARSPIEIAIRGRDASGPGGAVFFGRPELFTADPVLTEVQLPLGSWQMAAVPRAGWPRQADNVWALRLIFAGVSLVVLGALVVLFRASIYLERQVEERTRQLATAKAAAEAASVAKSAFLANMSHEIRTPLNAITGLAHLVRRSGVSAVQAARLDHLEIASRHLLDVINSILDLSKIEAGKFELAHMDVRLDDLVANVASILRDRLQAKGLALDITVEPSTQALQGDPARLQQALLNYASNAVKFTERGRVSLRVTQAPEGPDAVRVRFEVQDTGMGIAPESMPVLFSDFQQADNSATRAFGGTGLGLAITKRLAQLMGGEVGVSSTPGVGSTFWFTACLKTGSTGPKARPSAPVDDAEACLQRDHAGRRVLLAEDDQVNQLIALTLLEDVGLSVDVADDGAAAVAFARANPYAVILMDVQMPQMDGLEAARQIRSLAHHGRTPIVAITANAFAKDRADCTRAGMDDFIAKPFVPTELYQALLRWLSGPGA